MAASMLVPSPEHNIREVFTLFAIALNVSLVAILPPVEASAQDPDPPSVKAVHPLTRGDLPSPVPHPIVGTPGDGLPDRFAYAVLVQGLDQGVDNIDDWSVTIAVFRDGLFEESHGEIGPYAGGHTDDGKYLVMGEIDLPIDILQNTDLSYRGILKDQDRVVDMFEHDITMGNPEFNLHSTIVSNGMVTYPQGGTGQGPGRQIKLTSTVDGTIQLGFPSASVSPMSYQLRGAGVLNYENFNIEEPEPRCDITSSKYDGTFRVLEVAFPDTLADVGSTAGLLPPDEVVLFVDRGIRESGTVRCPGFPLPVLPLPRLIHFYAWFLSFHGGELGHANEVSRERGGFVITNWVLGAGNVIATRTYSRQGEKEGATFSEETRLELRWPE